MHTMKGPEPMIPSPDMPFFAKYAAYKKFPVPMVKPANNATAIQRQFLLHDPVLS